MIQWLRRIYYALKYPLVMTQVFDAEHETIITSYPWRGYIMVQTERRIFVLSQGNYSEDIMDLRVNCIGLYK